MPPPDAAAPPDTAALTGLTPMLAHYLEVKRAHPGCLVLYRMGDFYELFFEDAAVGAKALDLTLTSRGEQVGGKPVPMAGVPAHALDPYLLRLIRAGFRVAVCEQMEDPAEAKKRAGAKAMVKREVVRIVTPGTLSEDALLDARRHNYLAAFAEAAGETALAWLDMTTGDFACQAVPRAALAAALARLEPGEILVPEPLAAQPDLAEALAPWRRQTTPLPAVRFDSEGGKRRLMALYGIAALDSLGPLGRAEIAAAGALVDYVELTQKGRVPRLGRLARQGRGGAMEIDPATRRNLELTRTLAGERAGSLLAGIDRTRMGAGARLLAERLAAPLTDPAAIASRHDAVAWFAAETETREAIAALLARCPDLERALSRLALERGGPRDLAAIRDGLAAAAEARRILARASAPPPAEIAAALADLGDESALVSTLAAALAETLPLQARDGGFVRPGYDAALDEHAALRGDGRRRLAALEARYRAETDIPSLKIRHNNLLGYFIEITSAQAGKLAPEQAARFVHRQAMANATRYTTGELAALEEAISRAAEKALARELEIFETLAANAFARAEPIARAAAALAVLDVSAALAVLAVERRWTRPAVDDSAAFSVSGGRHPVVEAALADAAFVPNDCDLAPERRLWLVTGPNMAGKSTFLRQNALIAILAQMGAFVPAAAARLGVVDRLFSRVGAADDLARGRSTFMVEMVETAAILHQATARSLVILDEIGRGTATFDGLSIAWATLEYLHDAIGCRALFATHFHELTALAARLPGLACRTMRVKEWQGDVVFLHEVAPGTADRSYGIHVAKLAGLPVAVVARAEEVLAALERGEQSGAATRLADDLPLFTAAARRPKGAAAARPSPVEAALADIQPDALSPREALELVYRLKGLAAKE
jgi:DNA mismatch repair protein MutS